MPGRSNIFLSPCSMGIRGRGKVPLIPTTKPHIIIIIIIIIINLYAAYLQLYT